MQLILL